MKLLRLMTASLALTSLGVPQDLPPEVLLLSRVKAHMREEVAQLPNYTCLETITRFHRESAHARLRPLDTVRLEIVYSDRHEWYGSPGDRNLGVDNPVAFVGSGLIGTGAFALALNNILNGARFTYRGEESMNGWGSVKYDFLYGRDQGGFEISMVGGMGNVGAKGSVWVDPKSLDLIRLESHADDIPSYLPLAGQDTTVNYSRTQVGRRNALLAQSGDMQLQSTKGVGNYDHIDFTNCRAYSSQSELSFDVASAGPANSATKEPDALQPLPANQLVAIQLATPVTNRDAVGKLIEAKAVDAVMRKGVVIVPKGALLRGRIRRLERFQGSSRDESIVGLEFTEIEATGGPTPFYADFLRTDKIPGMRASLAERVVVHTGTESRIVEETITLPELPGVASFFIAGSAFTIPAGFRTYWRTRGPIRGYATP